MYDRYAIYAKPEQLRAAFAVDVPEGYAASYNAAPTQLLPVITSADKRGLSFFHWGLMAKWSNNKAIGAKSINLASDSIFQKVGYRNQVRTHRCVIPINGFYAWKRVSKKQVVPFYFSSKQVPVLAIAGLWEEFEDIDGELSHSFIMLTVPSSRALEEIDVQMPALLDAAGALNWLEDKELAEYQSQLSTITQQHPALQSHPVSPAINKPENNYPELINQVTPADQHGNYTLFA